MREIFIFDIDGTLANTDHRIHNIQPPVGQKKNWHKFFMEGIDDPVYDHVAHVLRALRSHSFEIVLLTGRPENYRRVTENWLRENNLSYDSLYMRPADSRGEDWKIKEELFWKICEGKKENVLGVFEDRKAVVHMWRRLGVPVFVCGDDFFTYPPDLVALARRVIGDQPIHDLKEIDNDEFYVVWGDYQFSRFNKAQLRDMIENG